MNAKKTALLAARAALEIANAEFASRAHTLPAEPEDVDSPEWNEWCDAESALSEECGIYAAFDAIRAAEKALVSAFFERAPTKVRFGDRTIDLKAAAEKNVVTRRKIADLALRCDDETFAGLDAIARVILV